jgi:glycerophosphoryl diester phosphodiesterase
MDLLECDINMTKDGVIVISHDDDLKRQCGIARNITEFNFDEIPPMMR